MKRLSTTLLGITLSAFLSAQGFAQCAPDNTAPVISGVPGDATVECAALPPPVAVTATDDCDANPLVSLDLTYSSPGIDEVVVVTRTWTATDADGNSSTASQTVTVIDTISPEISCPPDASVECLGDIDPSNTGSATGSDSCGSVTISHNDTLMSGASCQIERVWTAADWCGNETDCKQVITLTDHEAPVITCPDSVEFECPADTDSDAAGSATATDNCDYEISSSDETTPGCGDTLKIERTWTATDSCGNSSSCVQMIEVIDTSAPSIACPPSITLECPTDTGVGANGSATGSDTCGDVTAIESSDSSAPGCGGSETITRTWTATDECNNSSSCDQVITVLDTTAPAITCPADVTVECTASTAPGGGNGAASATDACSGVGINYSDASAPGCGNTETITRSWTATDACGNSSSCDQTVTVVDTTAPSISCPAATVIECTSSSATGVTGEATGSDTCGGVSIDHSDSVAAGDCGNNVVITRTFTATDDCGNSNSCTQTISTEDTTAPSITCPADAVIECATSASPDVTGGATASDTCGGVSIHYSDSVADNGCGNNVVITRTFTATDDCGNSNSCTQTITTEDTTAPSISCPADVTLECLEDTGAGATGSATGSDTCGGVTIGSSDSSAPGCGGSETITRTWTATDECNNSNSCDQTITVVDTTAPVITCPADVTVECTDPTVPGGSNGTATATDACSLIGYNYSDASAPGCGNSETITRTWTATDECGNSSSCDQTVTVVDTTAPSISCPADGTVECGESTQVGSATGGDSCGGIRIHSADTFAPSCGGDAGVITRTWTAVDDCGNSTSCNQVVTIIDTTPPEVFCNGNDITEFDGDDDDDDDDGVSFTATAVDVCSNVRIKVGWIAIMPPPGDDDDDDDDSKVKAKGATITILDSGSPGTVINWTAKSIDDCGNISAVSCSVTVLEKEGGHGHGHGDDDDDDDGHHPWWGHH
jgi:hypothetical protein